MNNTESICISNNTESICISNDTYFYYEYFSDFLKRSPQIPTCNRDYITERVNEFYQKILEYKYINVNNQYQIPYFNVLHIANLDGILYLCDGQHRFLAYKKYYILSNIDFKISYVVKVCKSKDELKNYFRDLNNIFILHDIILDDDGIDKLERIKTYMKNNYDKHISKSISPKFPNLNLDQLVKYLIDTFPNLNYTELLNKIDLINNGIKETLETTNKNYYDLAMKKQGFFLGYLFIKTELENRRKNIPKTVRDSLWNKFFFEELNGNCSVCNVKINYHNFHAGHIISVKDGGTNNINNLEPLCSSCNLSMGTQNLHEFKNKYF